MGKPIWVPALGVLMCLFACAPAVAAGDALEDFVATYQCSLADLIATIHAHPGNPGDNVRFIALSMPLPSRSFEQCVFEPGDHRVVCSGNSGWLGKGPAPTRLTSTQTWALERLGFMVFDSAGAFQKELSFPGDSLEPHGLADLMLRSLYDGYGARKGMAIKVATTYALRNADLPEQRCVPIS